MIITNVHIVNCYNSVYIPKSHMSFLAGFLGRLYRKDKDKTMEFIRTLTKVCDPMGIRVAQPRL